MRARIVGLAALCLLLGAACGSPEPAPVSPCAGGAPRCLDVRVVAHEDDDLLFMNPDLAASLAQGNRVAVVFVTAGTTGDPARLAERERGALNAYTYMVAPGLAATRRAAADVDAMLAHWRWHEGAAFALDPGHRVVRYDFAGPLPSGGALSLVFLRLPEENGVTDLDGLWRGAVTELRGVDGGTDAPLGATLYPQRYTREGLVLTLERLIGRFEAEAGDALPVSVSTLDATDLFVHPAPGTSWFDNVDHIAVARFTLAALAWHPRRGALSVRQYRGYDVSVEKRNLRAADTLAKARTFYRYFVLAEPEEDSLPDGTHRRLSNADPADPHFWLQSYESFMRRRYFEDTLGAARGRLAVGSGCLRHAGDALSVGPCAEAPLWSFDADGTLHPADDAAHCVQLGVGDDRATLGTCATAARTARTFLRGSRGQLRTRDALCLAAGVSLAAEPCAGLLDDAGHPRERPVARQAWHFE